VCGDSRRLRRWRTIDARNGSAGRFAAAAEDGNRTGYALDVTAFVFAVASERIDDGSSKSNSESSEAVPEYADHGCSLATLWGMFIDNNALPFPVLRGKVEGYSLLRSQGN
jgi:hypothetical protein